jgi:hemerythrin-like metal-binding protein
MSRKGKENVDLGVKEIDSEHDLMLGLVRALESAVASEFASVHFATEEIMMRLHAYQEFAAHQLEHARLMDQIDKVRSEFAAGNVQPTQAFASALRHWFIEHVRTHDIALARFVRESEITPA